MCPTHAPYMRIFARQRLFGNPNPGPQANPNPGVGPTLETYLGTGLNPNPVGGGPTLETYPGDPPWRATLEGYPGGLPWRETAPG
jgi:hypothetical protein